MQSKRTPLIDAIKELSYVCDLLFLDLPTLECNVDFLTRILVEFRQKYPNMPIKDYKSLYGIEFKQRKEV